MTMKPEGMSEGRLVEIAKTPTELEMRSRRGWMSDTMAEANFVAAHQMRELVAEVRRLRGALKVVGDEGLEINGRLLTENASIASKLAVATEALRWYADDDNYDEGSSFLRGMSKVQGDKGWRADAALKQIEGDNG